jgi:hypothetical protein
LSKKIFAFFHLLKRRSNGMRFLLSVVLWLFGLGLGGFVGYLIGEGVGAIVGVIVAQVIMAARTPGPKYPGDTNF